MHEPLHADDDYRQLIDAAIAQHADCDRAAWAVDSGLDRPAIWLRVSPRGQNASQGWKLHVSATIHSAGDVLAACLPILTAASVPFKCAASKAALAQINNGDGGLGQIGKFLTAYPQTDEQAVALVAALDTATRGFAGPRIRSEPRLHSSSLVHYRYGAYGPGLIQTPRGDIAYSMTAPDGTLAPDLRGAKPSWAGDPFAAAGLAQPEPGSRTLADRYVVTAQIYESPRGILAIAADATEGRSVIVKQAWRWRGVTDSGEDATDRLRAEAQILRRLAGSAYFPALYDEFEHNGDYVIVMEDIGSGTLEAELKRHRQIGAPPDAERVATWARALASATREMHERGIVYRDLKPANVVLTGDGADIPLRLLDFDSAVETGAAAAVRWGTRGYMSPGHVAGAPASPFDDIYGLGATLYAVITLAEPAAQPPDRPLRQIESLNPDADSGLAAIVTRCISGEYSAIADVADALDSWAPAAKAAATTALTTPALPEAIDLGRFREKARRIGFALAESALASPGGGLVWRSRHHHGFGIHARDIDCGLAGTTLALADLACVFPEFASVLEGAVTSLLAPSPIANRAPGLYVGEAGEAAALLRAGLTAERPDWKSAAKSLAARLMSAIPDSPDLYHGAAGLLRLAILVWDNLRDRECLEAALKIGDALCDGAQTDIHGALWRIPGPGDMAGKTPLGYAHGAAGIGDVLLDLYDVCGAARYRDVAAECVRALRRNAAQCLPESCGLGWPVLPGKPLSPPFWCHGATGIGQFLLHAAQTGIDDALGMARFAARSAACGARWADPTLCHGLAGNIELLLDMHQATGDVGYHNDALELAALLETFEVERGNGSVYSSEQPTVFSPDYMVGYAGIAGCLLRLADPTRRPRQLSRAGFRFFG